MSANVAFVGWEPTLLEYWYQALRTPRGIKLRTSDRAKLQRELYAARKASLDKELESLSIVPSPTDARVLWIVKRNGQAQGNCEDSEGNLEPL